MQLRGCRDAVAANDMTGGILSKVRPGDQTSPPEGERLCESLLSSFLASLCSHSLQLCMPKSKQTTPTTMFSTGRPCKLWTTFLFIEPISNGRCGSTKRVFTSHVTPPVCSIHVGG